MTYDKDYPDTARVHDPRAVIGQLRARRAAARRLVPLDCGCRDPWPCRCTCTPLSQWALDGWRDAAAHLLDTGWMPVLPIEVCRALWRRGGPDRALAELVWGEVAA